MFNWYFNLLDSVSYNLFVVMGVPILIGLAIIFIAVGIHDIIKK